MEREVGGGIGMGNTCKPMVDSFQCMTKSTTKKKKEIKEQFMCKIEHKCLRNYTMENKMWMDKKFEI